MVKRWRAKYTDRPTRHTLINDVARCLFALMLWGGAGAIARAQSSAPRNRTSETAIGNISGTAYDSLLMKPMAGVQVQLPHLNMSTRTNDRGRFRFDNVPEGEHELTLNSTALDTLGFGILGAKASVIAGKRAQINIATPSLRTMWNRNCLRSNTIGSDSGIVWGTIRDAATQNALSQAAATFHWFDLRPGDAAGLHIREVDEQAQTNADGIYFACGIPSDVAIGSEGITLGAASGRIDYALGARRMQRLDLTVSPEMVINDSTAADSSNRDSTSGRTSADSTTGGTPRGSAIVRGRVLDEQHQPAVNALVAIVNLDSVVRTDSSGRFQIAGLPAGTQLLNVRRVGSAPVNNVVHLRPGRTSDIDIVITSVNALTTVNVRAERSMSRDRMGFEQRKKNAFVRVREGEIFQQRADMYSVLDNIPRLRMTRNGFGLDVRIRRVGRGECTANAFLDGFPTDINTASSLPVEIYRAVEVYENPYVVPAEFTPVGGELCGSILFWTKRVKW